jgi:hypothetical protein
VVTERVENSSQGQVDPMSVVLPSRLGQDLHEPEMDLLQGGVKCVSSAGAHRCLPLRFVSTIPRFGADLFFKGQRYPLCVGMAESPRVIARTSLLQQRQRQSHIPRPAAEPRQTLFKFAHPLQRGEDPLDTPPVAPTDVWHGEHAQPGRQGLTDGGREID